VSESPGPRRTPPPPLEANDQLVTGTVTIGWAVALIVLLIVRGSLPADARWWIWTCAAGLVMGLFGLWYVPRLKRARARSAARRTAAQQAQPTEPGQPAEPAMPGQPGQSAPRDSGSNTVSSTDTPGRSTMS
jgi:ABC-type nickel/cobalt efflux system permease component RcnA